MDPKQTLQDAADALKSGDFDTCRTLLRAYDEWRYRGGFQPLYGDVRASQIASRLQTLGGLR
jgi:hypothetical protein